MKDVLKYSTCIVTGGAGFIGKHLVRQLIQKKSRVYIIDNFSFGSDLTALPKQAGIIRGDVRDKNIFRKLPRQNYHFFFHLAAPSTTALFKNNLTDCLDTAITGFINAVSFAHSQHIKFYYASSGSLYSGIDPLHAENSVLNLSALNQYARAKLITEQIAGLYPNTLGFRILAGYGPGEEKKGKYASVVYEFCRKMSQTKPPIVWGNGSQRRDFIFIADIIDVILNLAVQKVNHPVINVGTGDDISFNDLVLLLNKQLKKNIKPVYRPTPPSYLKRTIADTTLLKKYYHKPFTDIVSGVQKTLAAINKVL
ncbi:NAD-dependent epimerase/dehydratase family protein [Candidatus Roizmanbacteria bacterium]|nr:NAD-dependent epimerase/dehydratase family protein [Candidatus Roizmanbacteria bacterium]